MSGNATVSFERWVFTADRTKDGKPHDEIGTIGRARATLRRAREGKEPPAWFAGSVEEYRATVEEAVFGLYQALSTEKPAAGAVGFGADYLTLGEQDSFTQLDGGPRFQKDILRVGEYTHPKTKQRISVTRELLAELSANTNALISRGVKVPIPLGHTNAPEKNTGFIERTSVAGDELLGVCRFEDPQIIPKVGKTLTDVSAFIEPEVEMSQGPNIGTAMTHVCITSYPVINSQRNFEPIACSADSLGVGFYVEDSNVDAVKLDVLRKALALSNDATEADVLKAIGDKTKPVEAPKPDAELADLRAKVTALSAENAKLVDRTSTLEASEINKEIALALEKGQINVEQAAFAKSLLKSQASIALDVNGKSEERPLASAVRDFIKAATPASKRLESAVALSNEEKDRLKAETMAKRKIQAAAYKHENQSHEIVWLDQEDGTKDWHAELPKAEKNGVAL